MKEKDTLANDLMWLFGIASVCFSAYAIETLNSDAFYTAAGLGLAAFSCYLYDSSAP